MFFIFIVIPIIIFIIAYTMKLEKNGVTFSMFEYFYTTGSGKSSTTYRQTVTLLSAPQLKLPQFMLKPEGLFQKIGEIFGAKISIRH